jgi:DNA (cytosine-5)-methyltransferase 1
MLEEQLSLVDRITQKNNEIDKSSHDLKHRKSRYSNMREMLDDEYRESYIEVDTTKMDNKKSDFNYVDIFAGAGGLSLGIKQAGFNKICDVEILPFAHETLKYNFPEAEHYNGDISEFNVKEYVGEKKIHLVVGGPPCQGFSVAGKRKPDDQRNFLFNEYLRVVKETNPYFFVLENVPGIITLKEGEFYHSIVKGFNKLGYEVSVRILESADYGVPQLRTRAIFIGNRLGIKNPYPKKIYEPKDYKTIDSAIKDLENTPRNAEINHEWTKHSKQMIERISQVQPGSSLYETFSDSYKRQRVGHPSMTIKENHGGTHIHYKLNRCISTREMARIQTFPDDFIFKGTYKQGFIQVGNAVPPLLAKHIGLAIRNYIDKIEKNNR